MIDKQDWIWRGLAGHFCAADNCIFTLCTDIGKYRISTVGAMYWREGGRRVLKELGYKRHYETMVFLRNGDHVSMQELDIDGIYCGDGVTLSNAEYDEKARQMHIKMCEKYAKDEYQKLEYIDEGGFYSFVEDK